MSASEIQLFWSFALLATIAGAFAVFGALLIGNAIYERFNSFDAKRARRNKANARRRAARRAY